MGYSPVPATAEVISRYASFLARSLKFNSVKQYLNIIRLLHAEWDLPNPLENNFHLHHTLRGTRGSLGDAVKKKLPITQNILKQIFLKIDMSNVCDASMRAACLTLFFGFLRKASVLPSTHRSFNAKHLICKQDLSFSQQGLTITVRRTKTIQHQERMLTLQFPRHKNSIFCPVQAVFHALSFATSSDQRGPIFICDKRNTPLSAPLFVKKIT